MEVIPFSEEAFAQALCNDHSDADIIRSKKHFKYFNSYLGSDGGIEARSMVIEELYVNKDYLHDYASYYAFCFEHYHKFCKRIHFFSSSLDKEQLQAAILDKSNIDFWESYLGFIVVKPIPVTVVGYTALKVYYKNDPDGLRRFWGTRKYKVHFFGRLLKINTLAFQEQDSVLAACATTAIWSMLNKASTDFHTILKVPSEITRDADVLSNDGSRLFPNKGLDTLQICQAINNSGLAPEVRTGTVLKKDASGVEDFVITNSNLRKIINAYQHIGIPLILLIKVPIGKAYGYHAVACVGHKLLPDVATVTADSRFIASRIEKMYVHDDQYGPFAWAKFLEDDPGIESPWTSDHQESWPTYVNQIVIPVYPKIRISYEDIEALVVALDLILRRAFEQDLNEILYWDIKVLYSEKFKSDVLTSGLTAMEKLLIVEQSMPKYIWKADCYLGSSRFIEFTFDATDVSNGMLLENVIWYFDDAVRQHLRLYIEETGNELATLFEGAGGKKYIEYLLKKINPAV